jgi:RimJ/RimL family protein N-acetyltransferase
MDVLHFRDAGTFAERVGPVIERYPAFASVLASNLDQDRHGPGLPAHWFLIQVGGQPVGAAMQTGTYPLFITPAPDPDTAMPALAAAVRRAGLTLPGLHGPLAQAQAFSRAWEQQTGRPARPAGRDRLYEIEAAPPLPDSGSARPATEADLALATRWTRQFLAEALPEETTDAELSVRRRLARGRLLFWETEDGPVSMAGITRPIAAVVRIGGVYTPEELRGKGFGSAVTIAAVRQGFADGAGRCILYADLANPTSNRIYQAIGFRPVGDSARFSLAP